MFVTNSTTRWQASLCKHVQLQARLTTLCLIWICTAVKWTDSNKSHKLYGLPLWWLRKVAVICLCTGKPLSPIIVYCTLCNVEQTKIPILNYHQQASDIWKIPLKSFCLSGDVNISWSWYCLRYELVFHWHCSIDTPKPRSYSVMRWSLWQWLNRYELGPTILAVIKSCF